jgi:RNA polymerase-binding transcription factor DksA
MADYTARRAQLMARLKELDHRLHDIEAELDEPHSPDWEEAAIEREDEEVLERMGAASQQEIARIRAALERMRREEYGICVRCGTGISEERLDVLPATPFCRDCAR